MVCLNPEHLSREHSSRTHSRGVVYVEFLIAFFPLLMLFLGVCQLSLIGAARIVVQHAASSAARSAVVVLYDDPRCHSQAPRGVLEARQGSPTSNPYNTLLEALGVKERPEYRLGGGVGITSGIQRGPRMTPIRLAAYTPLGILAPAPVWLGPEAGPASLETSLHTDIPMSLLFAIKYNRGAAVISVHPGPGRPEPIPEPVGPDAPVTVRVAYFYLCTVPLVRALVCDTLDDLLPEEEDDEASEAAEETESSDAVPTSLLERVRRFADNQQALLDYRGTAARFIVLQAEATLPNQGAEYELSAETPAGPCPDS